ncbi:hypothetical protein LTR22_027965 [Elasticomyces elasticus]|nr:hypothetical protein LTR22_027965 [Elasticomyces elasticus]
MSGQEHGDHDRFAEIAHAILAAIRDEARDWPQSDLIDPENNVARDALNEKRNHLEELYIAALGVQDRSRGRTPSPADQTAVDQEAAKKFCQAVLGKRRRPCAKLLAIVLTITMDPAHSLWQRYVSNVVPDSARDPQIELHDSQLPLTADKIAALFGSDGVMDFDAAQHHFCPVDFEIYFDNVRSKLSRFIYDALCVPKQWKEDGALQAQNELEKFYPSDAAKTVFARHDDLLQAMYVELQKHRQPKTPLP